MENIQNQVYLRRAGLDKCHEKRGNTEVMRSIVTLSKTTFLWGCLTLPMLVS